MGQQFCYENSAKKPRKDFYKPNGLVDGYLSTIFRQRHKHSLDYKSLLPHFDAQIVGCTVTNDRRKAAGFDDTSDCRFCGATKESLNHIVRECGASSIAPKKLQEHEFGSNFMLLVIFEHPVKVADQRLAMTAWDPSCIAVFDPSKPHVSLWTDGSVVFPESFWLTCAAYSIVDEQEQCIEVDCVRHLCLNSYTAELYAILQAFAKQDGPLTIHTDCQTIVDLFQTFLTTERIAKSWSQFGHVVTNCQYLARSQTHSFHAFAVEVAESTCLRPCPAQQHFDGTYTTFWPHTASSSVQPHSRRGCKDMCPSVCSNPSSIVSICSAGGVQTTGCAC